MPVIGTSNLRNESRSPRPYGGGAPGFAFTRSHTSANLFQDNSFRSGGGGGLLPSKSSAFLAPGPTSRPLNKSPSSSFLRDIPGRSGGASRPTSLLFEPSSPSPKATTPTKTLYSPISGNTRSLVNALNSLGKGEDNSSLQVILGKKTKCAEEIKKPDRPYIPRHAGVSSYAKAFLDRTKQSQFEWPKRKNRPREIDTRDINLNKDKPPAPIAKPGISNDTPYRDNSVTRNRSVVRITSRRKKSVKDNAPKTVGQKLMEKYVERDKDENKPDTTEYVPRNRRFMDMYTAIPPCEKLRGGNDIPDPENSLPLLQRSSKETFENPKPLIPVTIKPPVVDSSSSDSNSDEEDDAVLRIHRATELAANKKNLEDTQDVKDAIIAAILHPDIDIESDEEMQTLIADDSRSSSSSKGSVNSIKKNQSKKRQSKDKSVNNLENIVEQNNNVINAKNTECKGEGEAIVGQIKRFVKHQISIKRSSPYSSIKKHPAESKAPQSKHISQSNNSDMQTKQLIDTRQSPAKSSLCKDGKEMLQENPTSNLQNTSVSKTETGFPSVLSNSSPNEGQKDSYDIPHTTLKSTVITESIKNKQNQSSQYKEKQQEPQLEINKSDSTKNVTESIVSAKPAEGSNKQTENTTGKATVVIQRPAGKFCGVPWGELAPGAPDIPVEPEWPKNSKPKKVSNKTKDNKINGLSNNNASSPISETDKNANGEKKAIKRPRQILPPPKTENNCISNILEARKILKRPVKNKDTDKELTDNATDIASAGKKILKKPITSKEGPPASLENQLKDLKKVLKAPGTGEDRQKKNIKKTHFKKDRSSSSSSEASSTKKSGEDKPKKGKGKKSPSKDVTLKVTDSKEALSQSADSGYGSSPSTPLPIPGQTDVKNVEEICNVCGTNCHKKCEKQMPNLCGVNQKLLAEALSSVKKGSGAGGQDSGVTPATGGSLSEDNDDDTETESDTADYFGSPEIRSPLQSRPKFKNYSLEDFNFVKVLGKGSYGKVMLAEQKGTENYFAIKCLKKDVVLEDNDVECTLIERKVLTLGTKHPYLCHLFSSFQTPSHLFFVMEYLTGGDLMFHIQHCGRFDEYRACFYAAEITSGLKFLHNKGIIYRDLKLDNILLDYQGHIRIADFGMCKLQIYLDRYADTFCGTPDYMAPEVIKGQHYNQCVDWWSFGVLLYEMLTGKSPFKGCDEDHLFWLICHDEPFYPKFLSREATEILKQLLDKDSSRRLGVPFSPYGELKDHPFFHYIDWQKIERKEVETPYKPRLRHLRDVQYFDPQFTKRRAHVTPLEESILSELDQTAFKDFSYTNPNIPDINEKPSWSKFQMQNYKL